MMHTLLVQYVLAFDLEHRYISPNFDECLASAR